MMAAAAATAEAAASSCKLRRLAGTRPVGKAQPPQPPPGGDSDGPSQRAAPPPPLPPRCNLGKSRSIRTRRQARPAPARPSWEGKLALRVRERRGDVVWGASGHPGTVTITSGGLVPARPELVLHPHPPLLGPGVGFGARTTAENPGREGKMSREQVGPSRMPCREVKGRCPGYSHGAAVLHVEPGHPRDLSEGPQINPVNKHCKSSPLLIPNPVNSGRCHPRKSKAFGRPPSFLRR